MVNLNKPMVTKSAEIIALEKKYTNQNPTDFVIWHRYVQTLLKPKLVWDSSRGNTYIKSKHGKIGA